MPDYIVVVGSVTAEQYSDARMRMLREGKRPKIIRMEPEDVFLADEQLAKLRPEDPIWPDAFKRIAVGDIVSFVVPMELWDVVGAGDQYRCIFQNSDFEFDFERLEHRWLLQPDGHLYFV